MGKLSEYHAQLKLEQDPVKIKDLQNKINQIESWCIEQGFEGWKLTDWTEWSKKPKKEYRFESERIGIFNPPDNAYIGKDRCGCCKWNRHPWCDRGKTKPCMANV